MDIRAAAILAGDALFTSERNEGFESSLTSLALEFIDWHEMNAMLDPASEQGLCQGLMEFVWRLYLIAMASISTLASLGRRDTSTAARAG